MFTIIPAIDLINGNCVRLTQGDFDEVSTYALDPLEQARRFADAGLKRLHLVDLDGARSGRPSKTHQAILAKIAKLSPLEIDYSGGIRSIDDVAAALGNGAAKVCIGSIAISNRALASDCLAQFGEDRFILAADIKEGVLVTHGWRSSSGIKLYDFIDQMTSLGFWKIQVTDISCDGTMLGPPVSLYADLVNRFDRCEFIASGGIACSNDIRRLSAIGVREAIVGKAFYEGKLDLQEASWLQSEL